MRCMRYLVSTLVLPHFRATSLLGRKLLVLTLIIADVLSIRSWSGAIASLYDLSARCRTYLSCTFAHSRIVVMYLGPRGHTVVLSYEE